MMFYLELKLFDCMYVRLPLIAVIVKPINFLKWRGAKGVKHCSMGGDESNICSEFIHLFPPTYT